MLLPGSSSIRQPGVYRAVHEVELLTGFETFTGTDELTIETSERNSNGEYILSTDYPGGQGSYESYGYYRYGFNGKENDNEVKGSGNQQDYGMRIYDPRLGRFLSVDPLTKSYPYYSPYHFAGNMPIAAIDIDGLEQYVVVHYKDNTGKSYKIEITTATDNSGHLIDQNVKKAVNYKDGTVGQTGEKIAKGNVLVFELYNEGSKNAQLNIIRNTNDPKKDKLTPQELNVYNKKKTLLPEKGEEESLVYSSGITSIYASYPLRNSLTKTYVAEQKLSNNVQRIVVPPDLSGNLANLFVIGTTPTLPGNMPNGSLFNAGQPEVGMYNQLLNNIRNAGGAASVNVNLNFRPISGVSSAQQAAYQVGIRNIQQRLINDFTQAGVRNINVSVTSSSSQPEGSTIIVNQ